MSAEQLRANLERRRYPNLSRLAITLLRALRDNATWRGESASWLAVALWAHEWTDYKPTREEVAAALEELRAEKRRWQEERAERGAA